MRKTLILAALAASVLTACDRSDTGKNPATAPTVPTSAPAVLPTEPKFRGRTLSEWIGDTQDKEERTRRNAYVAIGEIGDRRKSAIDCLKAGASDKSLNVRSDAARALHFIGEDSTYLVSVDKELLASLRKPYRTPTVLMACEMAKELGKAGKGLLPELLQMKKEAQEVLSANPNPTDVHSELAVSDAKQSLESLDPLIKDLSPK